MRKAYTVIFKNTDKCKKGKILSVMIVYHEGCVNYLLLFNKLPHKLVAKSKHYYLMLYISKEWEGLSHLHFPSFYIAKVLF